MPWPPRIGDRLPRAEDAWCEEAKLLRWVLGPGHGAEWHRVFRVGPEDKWIVWTAIRKSAVGTEIFEVRFPPEGVSCGVRTEIAINGRKAPVVISWHYSDPTAAPRLATAYTTL
jgi:hypothetical protein